MLPDHRLDALAAMSKSRKVVHTGVEMVDIAGLVAGSSTGEGLGNRFLGGIREVDALLFVLRAFEDPEIPGESDPLAAFETLELELVLADVASVEGQIDRRRKAARADKSLLDEVEAMADALEVLQQGTPLYRSNDSEEKKQLRRGLFLLTDKPVLAIVNIGEDQLEQADSLTKPISDELEGHGEVLAACVQLEAEVAQLTQEERPRCRRTSAWAKGPLPVSRARRITCSAAGRFSRQVTRSHTPGAFVQGRQLRSAQGSSTPTCSGVSSVPR